jgi:hypothetical protein
VLADGEAEYVGRFGQGEAVDGDIVRGFGDFADFELLELIWYQYLARFAAGGCWEMLADVENVGCGRRYQR